MADNRTAPTRHVVFPRLLSLAIGIDRLISHRDQLLQRCLNELCAAGVADTPRSREEADNYVCSLLTCLSIGNLAGHLEFLRARLRATGHACSRERKELRYHNGPPGGLILRGDLA